MGYLDTIWHKTLRRPYKLSPSIMEGKGQRVVLLHGIGVRADDWLPAIEVLRRYPVRIEAYDLLGFGRSPKPDWKNYDVDDHAESVATSIKSNGQGPVILVGHSMGAVVATRVARNHPKLVKHLILYQIPVFTNHPGLSLYDFVNKMFLTMFNVAANNPRYTIKLAEVLNKLNKDIFDLEINAENWNQFKLSLNNTIMKDTVYDDLNSIRVPVDVIYGKFDLLVIDKGMKKVFKKTDNVSFHKVNEVHKITKRTGVILRELILPGLSRS